MTPSLGMEVVTMSNQTRERRRTGFRGHRGHLGGRRIEQAKDPRSALKRLLSYLRPFRLQLVISIFLVVISTLLSLSGP